MTTKTDETLLQYHIEMKPGDVGRYVLMPGDPGRVPVIASFLDGATQVAENREHRSFTGTLDNVPVSVTSTGVGGPSTAIAIEELAKIGADTFIRVGTSGIVHDSVLPGDLIVVTSAVRDEGTAMQYMPMAFPAVAALDVVACLRQACEHRSIAHHVGISHSKDSFYGEIDPERMPVSDRLKERWQSWIQGRVLCSEMEAAALFVIASTLRKRAGGLMVAGGSHNGLEPLCRTAIEGVRLLIQLDQSTGT